MIRRFLMSPLGLAACFLAVVISALSVVKETHQTRMLFATLQAQESERWLLQEDYSRLVLEYSTRQHKQSRQGHHHERSSHRFNCANPDR